MLTKLIRYLFIIVLSLSARRLVAADTLVIKKDARLDILSQKQAQINKRTSLMTSTGLFKGYRIQVISTPSREKAQQLKTEMMSRFPEHKSYLLFQSPNFKVRIGNFLKREDAEKIRNQLNRLLPSGVYVVEDAIEYTPKENELF